MDNKAFVENLLSPMMVEAYCHIKRVEWDEEEEITIIVCNDDSRHGVICLSDTRSGIVENLITVTRNDDRFGIDHLFGIA